jgi:cation diffusion facilitator family transporter
MSDAATTFGHDHVFLGRDHDRNARRTWWVIALTATMMVVEITAGTLFGSMALVADGWHMSTHAAALLISASAYAFARRHALNRRFTFGTGKFGDLAAFASAIVLVLVAVMIAWDSAIRLVTPVPISFAQAIGVAVAGLAVNLASAWILKGDHGHSHDHHHHHQHHDHDHAHAGQDNNLRSAYLHVLADALTSVLAIAALTAGSLYGWVWLDPVCGLVGAFVIAHWSFSLIRDSGGVLVDLIPEGEDLPDEIRQAIERDGDRISDLHVWQVGPGRHAAIVALVSARPEPPSAYRAKLAHLGELAHVTIEVEPQSVGP